MDPETLGGASANQNCCHVSTGLAVVISCACSTRRAERHSQAPGRRRKLASAAPCWHWERNCGCIVKMVKTCLSNLPSPILPHCCRHCLRQPRSTLFISSSADMKVSDSWVTSFALVAIPANEDDRGHQRGEGTFPLLVERRSMGLIEKTSCSLGCVRLIYADLLDWYEMCCCLLHTTQPGKLSTNIYILLSLILLPLHVQQ